MPEVIARVLPQWAIIDGRDGIGVGRHSSSQVIGKDEKQYYERCGQQEVTCTIVAFLLCCLLESTCLARVIGAKAFGAPETER